MTKSKLKQLLIKVRNGAFITPILEEIHQDKITLLKSLKGEEKRFDVEDFGADSISFPSGEIWTQDKRNGFNYATQKHNQLIDKKIKEYEKTTL